MTPDEDILDIFRDASDPFLGTGEVADVLDYSPQGASKRLDELVADGKLSRKSLVTPRSTGCPDVLIESTIYSFCRVTIKNSSHAGSERFRCS